VLSILREGFEAALIVVVVAGFLRPTERRSVTRWIWVAAALVVVLCLQYGGLARADEISWSQAFGHIVATLDGLRAMLGL
jgi:high-affinity Fe2+/Pb2+ permease